MDGGRRVEGLFQSCGSSYDLPTIESDRSAEKLRQECGESVGCRFLPMLSTKSMKSVNVRRVLVFTVKNRDGSPRKHDSEMHRGRLLFRMQKRSNEESFAKMQRVPWRSLVPSMLGDRFVLPERLSDRMRVLSRNGRPKSLSYPEFHSTPAIFIRRVTSGSVHVLHDPSVAYAVNPPRRLPHFFTRLRMMRIPTRKPSTRFFRTAAHVAPESQV